MSTQTTCESRLPLSVRNPSSLERIFNAITRITDGIRHYRADSESRRILRRLNDHQLRDIGLTRDDLGKSLDDPRDVLDRAQSGFPR